MSEVKMTTDYNLLKRIDCNRPYNESNVRKIMASMKIRFLLSSRPILVNKNFEIIDGQHRYLAAKNLGKPLYYIVEQDLSDEDIITLNTAQTNWSNEDYLNYYVQKQNDEYIKFNESWKLSGLPFNQFYRTMHPSKTAKDNIAFKQGKYKHNGDKALRVLQALSDVEVVTQFIKPKVHDSWTMVNKTYYKTSLVELMSFEGFHLKTFLNKMEYNIEKIHKCQSHSMYLKMWLDIYNWKNYKPIQVEV